ncbi:MAG: EthD domain-containing protein [Novosphingobium sp.]
MEKIIYALWRRPGETREALNARIEAEARPALLALPNVQGLRINYQDHAVTRAEGLRQFGTDPQMDAVVQLWIEVSHSPFRDPVDAALKAVAGDVAAWLVLESAIIPNRDHPPAPGERTYGWSQMCFLQKPAHLEHEEWRRIWQDSHTHVGAGTQSNFEYVQNLIVRPLIPGPLPYAAIVEECFPTDAMDDAHVFFDAVGDEERFARHTREMAESCARFLFMPGGVDVLPTSQYDARRAFA